MEIDSEISTSSIFTKDALAQLNLIDKYVTVEIIKNTVFCGFVHSIDPLTSSMILFTPYDDTYKTVLIPGHAILDIKETNPGTNACPPKRKTLTVTSLSDVTERKQKLISWFKWNLLSVTESDDIIVLGNVNVLPPYKTEDVYTDNPIIASKIKNLIETMPDNFKPK